MSTEGHVGWMTKLRSLPNDSAAKTLLVALSVSFACSLVVSTTAVLLKPLQRANRQIAREERIQEIVAKLPGVGGLLETIDVSAVEAQVVEFSTGKVVPEIDSAQYDAGRAAQDPQLSIALPPQQDIAGIERRAHFGTVYLIKKEERVQLLILPVYGSGYASTLQGFLALAGDLNTVVALTFYDHGETPGLGADIDEPEWRNQWQGKKVWDAEGDLRIGVAPGPLSPSNPETDFQVDGITGATQTGIGVTNLLRFWLGDQGFGPYLRELRSSGAITDG